jgi:hypothetical protein
VRRRLTEGPGDGRYRVTIRWASLVVDEGDPAVAEGVITRHPLSGYLFNTDQSTAVPVVISADLDVQDGDFVTATGVWRAGALHIDETASPSSTRVPPAPRDAGEGSTAGHDRLRPAAERALLEDGVLLDLWVDRADSRVYAVCTDTERVTRILAPRYGSSLVTVHSPWTAQLLEDLSRAIQVEGTTVILGHTTNADHQLIVDATLLHLPSYVAARLEQFPPEALALTVLVRPRHPTNAHDTQ